MIWLLLSKPYIQNQIIFKKLHRTAFQTTHLQKGQDTHTYTHTQKGWFLVSNTFQIQKANDSFESFPGGQRF